MYIKRINRVLVVLLCMLLLVTVSFRDNNKKFLESTKVTRGISGTVSICKPCNSLVTLVRPINYEGMYLVEDAPMYGTPEDSSKQLYTFKKGSKFSIVEENYGYYKALGHSDLAKKGYFSKGVLSKEQPRDELTVDNRIIWEGSQKTNVFEKIEDNWYKLPRGVRQRFIDEGWKFRVSADSSIYLGEFEAGGITYYGDKYILLPNDSINVDNSLIHEVGHFIDYMLSRDIGEDDLISAKSAWNNTCYLQEKDIVDRVWDFDLHGLSTHAEYFASCFKTYILYPDALEFSAPNTYTYLNSIDMVSN